MSGILSAIVQLDTLLKIVRRTYELEKNQSDTLFDNIFTPRTHMTLIGVILTDGCNNLKSN